MSSGSPGQKRARTASGGAPGDWTCPSCGNRNFSFRTTCNMRKCGAPKPGSEFSAPPVPAMSYGPVPGSAGPPVLPPPGVPLHPYEAQAAAPSYYQIVTPGAQMATAYLHPSAHASFDQPPTAALIPSSSYAPAPSHSPYAPQPLPPQYAAYGQATPPFAPADANGRHLKRRADGLDGRGAGGYDSPYGGAQAGGARGGGQGGRGRGGAGMSVDGDWVCPSCGNTNYAFRTSCNMRRCGAPKPAADKTPLPAPGPHEPYYAQGPPGTFPAGDYGTRPQDQRYAAANVASPPKSTPPEGSWTCEACGNLNYPFRTHCNKRHCGKPRHPEGDRSEPEPPAAGGTAPSATNGVDEGAGAAKGGSKGEGAEEQHVNGGEGGAEGS